MAATLDRDNCRPAELVPLGWLTQQQAAILTGLAASL